MDHDVYRRMAEIQAGHWWYEGRRRILRAVIRRLNLPQAALILEAGCGTGANLSMLKEFGTVQGFEPDDFAIDNARKTSNAAVEKGFLPGPVPFSGPFDLIGAFDVIEHIDDDKGSLRALYDLTKPGGYAVFTVPAYMFLWSRHDDVNHHKRRYVAPAFKGLLEEAGYRVEFISYYNTILFPVVAAVRFIKNVLKLEDSPDIAMPRWPAVNKILCAVFAAERHLLGRVCLPFGVSILAVCRKVAS